MAKRKPHAMILAAGLGTRLQPLTLELPKPLVPVGDASLLEHIARRLKYEGFESAAVNTHYMRSEFAKVFSRLPIDIRESFEPQILGTAGGVAALRSELESPVVVYNADIYCQAPLRHLSEQVRSGGTCLAIAPRKAGEGTVGIRAGQIVRLRGEIFGEEEAGGDYLGVLALSEESLAELPEQGCLIADHCLPRLRSGRPLGTLVVDKKWSDIGSLSEYVKSNFEWLDEHIDAPAGFLGEASQVGPGIEISRCILGREAEVRGTGLVERCIVWPGAKVYAPLRDVIVTHSGRVVPFQAFEETLK